MLRKIEEAKKSLTINDIEQAEKTLGVRFPLPYKKFLLQHNGGYPEPDSFDIDWTQGWVNSEVRQACSEDWLSSCFGRFLAVYDGEYSNFLEYNQNDFKGRIPKETIAIAYDASGNLILLGVSGDQAGKVLFWVKDHENWEGDDSVENIPWYDNIGLIANSFDEFINEKLRD